MSANHCAPIWLSRRRGPTPIDFYFAAQGSLAATVYMHAGPDAATVTETGSYCYVVPANGKITGLVAYATTAATGARVSDLIVRVNGANSALKVSFSAGQTSQSASLDVPVSRGDIVRIQHAIATGGGTALGGNVKVTVLFEASIGRLISLPYKGNAIPANGDQVASVGSIVGANAISIVNERQAQYTCPCAGVLTGFELFFDPVVGAATSGPATLRVNGADTAIATSVVAGSGALSASGSVAVAEGDLISLRINWTGANTRGPSGVIYGRRSATSAKRDYHPLLFWNRNTQIANAWLSLVVGGGLTSVFDNVSRLIGRAGTLNKLYYDCALVTDRDHTVTVWLNGSATAFSALVPTGSQVGSFTGSLAVAAGDRVGIRVTPATGGQNLLDMRCQILGEAA